MRGHTRIDMDSVEGKLYRHGMPCLYRMNVKAWQRRTMTFAYAGKSSPLLPAGDSGSFLLSPAVPPIGL
jgi:hypothetical protein